MEKIEKLIEEIDSLTVVELNDFIKVVRDATGLGLKEAKELVDGAPKTVKEGASKEEAEELKAKFTEVGAVIELQ